MKRKLPDHVLGTMREFKVRKRRELKAAEKALYVYFGGCAVCPHKNGEVDRLLDEFRATKKAISAKEWGR